MTVEDPTKVVTDATSAGNDRSSPPDSDSAAFGDSSSITAFDRGEPEALRPGLVRGRSLGRYVILDGLASGGMGAIYVAYDPELDRKVAIKVLKKQQVAELGGEDSLIREAQAMAQLSHPNVVNVFDTGVHEGAVFVAMEYVQGVTLRRWLQARPRTWREILSIYIRAGRGLAAAHKGGIVHRDFKPANVMVDPEGRPRVLDFGLAFPVGKDESIDPMRSSTSLQRSANAPSSGDSDPGGVLFGTPAYMSPEQWLGGFIDARSDQFSFCVALWDALYGAKPFVGDGLSSLRDAIVTGRPTEPKAMRGPIRLRRHLERGLKPASAERYPDMDALLTDLESDARLARRRMTFGVLGLAGAGLVSLGYLGASAQRSEDADVCTGAAERMSGVWDEATHHALEKAFTGSGQSYAAETYESVRASLDRASEEWVEMFTDACEATRVRREQSEPMLDKRMRCLELRLAEMSSTIDVLKTAEPAVVEHAVETVESLPPVSRCSLAEITVDEVPPPPPEIAADVAKLEEEKARAAALIPAGKIARAESIVQRALPQAQELEYSPLLADLYRIAASIAAEQGDPTAARAAALEGFRHAIAGKSDRLAAQLMLSRLRAAALAANATEGPELLSLAEAWVERVPHEPLLAYTLHSDSGLLRFNLGDFDGANEHFEQALQIVREEMPRARHRLAKVLNNLGGIAGAQRKYQRSIEFMTEALEIDRELLGSQHPWTLIILENIATSNHHLGQTELALRQFEEAIDVRERTLGEQHASLARLYNNVASIMVDDGRAADGLPYAEKSLEIRIATLGPDHPSTALVRANLAYTLAGHGRYDEARNQLDQAIADLDLDTGPHAYLVVALMGRVKLLKQQRKYDEALADLEHLERVEAQLELGDTIVGEILSERAQTFAARGDDRDEIRPLVAEALQRLQDPNARRELRDLEVWLERNPQYRPKP